MNAFSNDNVSKLSLVGRMAYVLMCVEAYLVHVYPDRDWRLLAKAFCFFSTTCFETWMLLYEQLTPDVALHDGEYNQIVQLLFTQDEYQYIIEQYRGITDGNLDDPNDELCMVLNIPFDLIYEYSADAPYMSLKTMMYAEKASVDAIEKIVDVLHKHHIELPDIHKLDSLVIKDKALVQVLSENTSESADIDKQKCLSRSNIEDIWGEHFDGEPLSIILNPNQ